MPRGNPPPVRIDGRRLSHAASAAIRRLATEMVARGERPSMVMAHFGLCRTTIYRWLRAVRERGPWALARKPHPGRKPRASPEQARSLREWIVGHVPADHGLDGRLWTRQAAALLLEVRTGVRLGTVATGRLLARLGLRPPALDDPRLGDGGHLVFAVDGRGAFLCRRVPAGASAKAQVRCREALAALAGRPVRFVDVAETAL